MGIFLYVILGVLLLVGIVAIISLAITKYKKNELKDFNPIFLGRLSDNKDDNIKQIVEYLKLTNSIKDRNEI